MIYNTLHNRWLRTAVAVLGQLFVAVALKMFIVPLNLYAGNIMGACQLANTFLRNFGIVAENSDIAGVLFFLINTPILLIAYKSLGRELAIKTIICTSSYSFFYSLIPTPAAPLVTDYWTACLIGGCLAGIGYGIVLTCGASGGGLDIIGLYLNKKGIHVSVGRVCLIFNIILYAICLAMFNVEIVIYSVIFNYCTSAMQDRMHQQNINVQALIFTRNDEGQIAQYVIEKLHRSVTYLNGVGAYNGTDVRVICVYLSKYEVEELLHAVGELDPQAFFTVQENVRVYGNFPKRLS